MNKQIFCEKHQEDKRMYASGAVYCRSCRTEAERKRCGYQGMTSRAHRSLSPDTILAKDALPGRVNKPKKHKIGPPIAWDPDYYTGSFRHQWSATIQTLEAETFKETRRWHGQRKEPGRMPTTAPTSPNELCTSTDGKAGNQAGAE